MALATSVDVEARLGRTLTADESVRMDALLEDASAAVILYTGQQFAEGTTTATIYPQRGFVYLPQRPVNSITSVEDTDGTSLGYSWFAGERIDLSSSPVADFAYVGPGLTAAPVVVTYEHGYANIPQAIIAVVCNMALRALGQTPTSSGIQQESIAGYSYSTGAAGAAGPVGLLPDEKKVLERYKRSSGRVLAGGW
jgi:hypothetical protein